jgi:pyruvate/2-oxoglutarate dehydrogenase complex dihydrolipoamide dehydrogenase (E3) component
MPHYDAIVIGAGQAGNPLSQKLADRGWSVALVEEEHLAEPVSIRAARRPRR